MVGAAVVSEPVRFRSAVILIGDGQLFWFRADRDGFHHFLILAARFGQRNCARLPVVPFRLAVRRPGAGIKIADAVFQLFRGSHPKGVRRGEGNRKVGCHREKIIVLQAEVPPILHRFRPADPRQIAFRLFRHLAVHLRRIFLPITLHLFQGFGRKNLFIIRIVFRLLDALHIIFVAGFMERYRNRAAHPATRIRENPGHKTVVLAGHLRINRYRIALLFRIQHHMPFGPELPAFIRPGQGQHSGMQRAFRHRSGLGQRLRAKKHHKNRHDQNDSLFHFTASFPTR